MEPPHVPSEEQAPPLPPPKDDPISTTIMASSEHPGPTPEGAAQAQREAIEQDLLARLQGHRDFLRSVGVEESSSMFGLGKVNDAPAAKETSDPSVDGGGAPGSGTVGATIPQEPTSSAAAVAETAAQPSSAPVAEPPQPKPTKGKGKDSTSTQVRSQTHNIAPPSSSFSFSGAATTFEPGAAPAAVAAAYPEAMDTALDSVGTAASYAVQAQDGPVSGNPQAYSGVNAPQDGQSQQQQQAQQNLLDGQMAEEQDLEADEDDSDSALGSDAASVTTSLSESIYNYRKEHGRTYHAYKDGKYIFPNDEREADRLDLQHHLLRITYANKLYFAPLDKPRRCLDVGTGTGIWAVDFADEHPECEVVGIDLSPGQPSLVPPNLKFIIDDAEDAWLYPEKFDFIHARLMSGCFADWPAFMQQSYENLEPGGWLEVQDYGLPVRSADGTHLNTSVHQWGQLLCSASLKMGRPLGSDASDHFVTYMEAAGFVDIQVKMFMWPTNSWPKDPYMKELGRWNQVNIIEGLEAFCLALLTRGLGWKKEEVDVLVAKTTRDLKDRKIHAYFPMPVVYGRKPRGGEIW